MFFKIVRKCEIPFNIKKVHIRQIERGLRAIEGTQALGL